MALARGARAPGHVPRSGPYPRHILADNALPPAGTPDSSNLRPCLTSRTRTRIHKHTKMKEAPGAGKSDARRALAHDRSVRASMNGPPREVPPRLQRRHSTGTVTAKARLFSTSRPTPAYSAYRSRAVMSPSSQRSKTLARGSGPCVQLDLIDLLHAALTAGLGNAAPQNHIRAGRQLWAEGV